MKRTGLTTRYWLATLALTTSIWAAPALAQSQDTMQPNMPPQGGEPARPVPQDPDELNRRQVAEFGEFLDRHPEVAEQLRRDPRLLDNPNFVQSHPELQTFLQDHPVIQRDAEQDPRAVMQQEDRFDRRNDDRGDNGGGDRNRVGIPQSELEPMRQFLNTHPEIAEQLQKDPSLIDNRKFVDEHSVLKQFLADHPAIQREFDEHPDAFMRGEDRDDRASGIQLTDLNEFLKKHPEIAEQLRKDPSLINSKAFVDNHPALQQFMRSHPQLTAELEENPNAIMRQDERYDRREDNGQGNWGHARDNDTNRASFHDFLENHNNIASELEKNPTLANNSEYLQNHTELQSYLQANPQVSAELQQNPQAFVKSSQSFDATAEPGVKTVPKTTMPTTDRMKKQ